MPRYEYKCEGCGEIFELQQKFADEPLTVHDKCGGRVERIISAPALQFKGSGWYVNDYAGKDASKPEASSAGPTPETKTGDSKPASADSAAASAPAAPAAAPSSSTSTTASSGS